MNKLGIIYQNEDFLVIDKPAGLVVNRSDTTIHFRTLQDLLEGDKIIDLSNLDSESDFVKRSGIVHRLDKETSGILLVAKSEEAFLLLQSLFKQRDIKKEYLGLVHGIVKPSVGSIIMPVGRLSWNKSKFGTVPGGKESETEYEVLNIYELKTKKGVNKYSLLLLRPKSGRTHQIRVHLKYMNHPVVSDYLYAGRKTSREDRRMLDRVFLHAYKINFKYMSEEYSFTSELPTELVSFLNTLDRVNQV